MKEKLTVPVSGEKDGYITVTFLNNDTEARADFIPPYGEGAPITSEYIKTLLARFKIVYGVRYEEIEKAALAANLSKRAQIGILIAEGTPPVLACPAYFVKNNYLENTRPIAEEGKQADYRRFSPFTIVKKGQILAEKIPESIGRTGTNVHGDVVPFETQTVSSPALGKNTFSDDKYIYASSDGQLIEDNGVLSVSDKLVIRGDVNYSTGNINFPGDVELDGSVADGFKVYVGGNFLAKQTLNATDVVVKGGIEVRGGIIGRGQATVKAGGEVKARFVENCKIAAWGNITINMEILNASIYTMGMLNVGSRGFIMGAEIYAVHGMKCAKIGRTAGKTSKIHVGVDFTVQKAIDKTINRLRPFTVKLEKLKTLISASGDATGGRYQKMIELRNKLDAEIKRLSAITDNLRKRVVVDEKAFVTIYGEISQGTLVEICQIALIIDRPLQRVTLQLDKARGKIVQTA
ncbi:MAG: FapA family protein [Treponema sp.]|jgi:uncharacterized protein (DUF342 family)|nr:FapA family protein [Treponema sp.]